jgi:predicted nicotinamide N-methyase
MPPNSISFGKAVPSRNVNPNLPQVPGGWREEIFTTPSRKLRIARPADPDLILDEAATLEENVRNDYMPYWCWLWPAAIRMSETVHKLPLDRDNPVLEVGCGLGLVGIAGLAAGFNIVLSDYRHEALAVAAYNARLNGFETQLRLVDWRAPVTEAFACAMACDVLYEVKEHMPILSFVDGLLTEHGECWIGDPGRINSVQFTESAGTQFEVQLFDEYLNRLEEPKLNEFYLIRLSRP